MQSIIDFQKRLLPDLVSVMQERYHILHYISLLEPVGRRNLAQSLGVTERVLRADVLFLKDQNLITITGVGMSLTQDGRDVLEGLEGIMRELSGFDKMEERLRTKLGIKKVIIVAGDTDQSPWIKSELGRACAACMKSSLDGKNIIAVTGGTTMATVAEVLTPDLGSNLLFVPARGGIGEDVQNQANVICSVMAERTQSRHKVLYVPDDLSNEAYQIMAKEPNIKEVLALIKSASMVLHGVGDAMTMAQRRRTNPDDLRKIEEMKAVGEAFGYYFNEAGEVVHKVQTVGLQLEDLASVDHVLAVAGGSSKEKAIRAYLKQAPPNTVLITDEGVATKLLEG